MLALPERGRNMIYQAIREEFNVKVIDKTFREHIAGYLTDKAGTGRIIVKQEIEEMIIELKKNIEE